jgi:adenylosuccinate synthase
MEVKIVVGFAFGDEGKGVTTQWLCKKAIEENKRVVVVRFSGGPQAGHTINYNGIEHICSSFGSGILLGVPTYLGNGVLVDPISLMKEYDSLVEKGVLRIRDKMPLIVGEYCTIITPYDVLANIRDPKALSDGTCGKGVYAAYKRGTLLAGTQYYNFKDAKGKFKIDAANSILKRSAAYYNMDRDYELDELFIQSYKRLVDLSIPSMCYDSYKDFDVAIFEGSQGLLLDSSKGFYPHVTATDVGPEAVLFPYGIIDMKIIELEMYLVTRTYLTRHGNGPLMSPPASLDLSNKHETNVYNKYQGEFRVGLLNIPLLNRAVDRYLLDTYGREYSCRCNLVVTHADIIEDNKGRFGFVDHCNNLHIGLEDPFRDLMVALKQGINLKFDKIYYNDSIESNIKEYEENPIDKDLG